MPVLSSLLQRVRTSGVNPAVNESGAMSINYGVRSWAGPTVSDDDALKIAAVWRAVSLIAPTIAGLPLQVYRRSEDSRDSIRTTATRLVWDEPNPELSRMTFWETILNHEVLHGNAFIFVAKNAFDQALELWPIEPRRMRVGRLPNGRKYYEVDNERPMIDFRLGGEIIHIMGLTMNGIVGLSPLRLAAQTLGLSRASEEYAARLFSQDASPRGLLSTEQDISKDEAEMLESRWARLSSGLSNVGRTRVLGKGVKWQATATTPVDAQLDLSRRFQIAEIARIFGVPPHLLADVERSTSWGSGIEEQNRIFLELVLMPHINRLEHAINRNLLGDSKYARFNVDGFLRGTLLQRAEAHRIALAGQAYRTVNEVRLLEELNPLDGGDELMVPLNMGEGGVDNEPDVPTVEEPEEPEARALNRNGNLVPLAEARCSNQACRRLLGKDITGGRILCVRCKTETTFALN